MKRVAQNCILPYRGFAIRLPPPSLAEFNSAIRQINNLRYGVAALTFKMVALWLRHDNDDDQRHSERNTPRIKKTRSGKPAQSEQRDNFYFRNNARRGEPKSCSNSTISERD
jgi:hypothetical protein